jgi:peptidoglycan/LPS O-acetylase OafA/YrhL
MNRQSVALGGLAIALVVLHHVIDFQFIWMRELGFVVTDRPAYYWLIPLYKIGHIAVPLFFFISGGFVAYAARGNPPRLSRQSVQSALLRLLWPYFIWSTVFYVLIYWQNGQQYSLAGYLKNYIVGYPYHFVPLLIFFYLISPLLVYWAESYGLLLILLFGLGQFVLLITNDPQLFGLVLPAWATAVRLPVLHTTLAQWAIFFPLGLILALDDNRIKPWLKRGTWLLLLLTVVSFALCLLDTFSLIRAPLAALLFPITFVLLAPQIKREWLPAVKALEYIGKRSYGVYFTQLLMIDILYLGVQQWLPWLIDVPLLLVPAIFALGLGIPLLIMYLFSAKPSRVAYRYVFG